MLEGDWLDHGAIAPPVAAGRTDANIKSCMDERFRSLIIFSDRSPREFILLEHKGIKVVRLFSGLYLDFSLMNKLNTKTKKMYKNYQ